MTDIWLPREQSLAMLESSLRAEREALAGLFDVCDDVLRNLHEHDSEIECHLTWLALLKARRVALGVYSMVLDCLGQEAGALLRLLQEIWEFLVYLEQDPARAQQVVESGKPQAGAIANEIGGQFHDLRKHLNENAAHLSLSSEALGHTIDLGTLSPRLTYSPTPGGLRRNLGSLFAFFFFAVAEATVLLSRHESATLDRYGDRLDSLRVVGYQRFRLDGNTPPAS